MQIAYSTTFKFSAFPIFFFHHGGKKWGIGESHSREILPFGGKFATWREILVNEIKKYIRNGGKFGYTEGKYLTIFPGNVAFFPAVFFTFIKHIKAIHMIHENGKSMFGP